MSKLIGYQPADVIAELRSDLARRALFTTFTFSPGAFQQQYVTPLVQHGCGDIVVLADRKGYAQSLFAAAAVQGIGTDYRLRQVPAAGAFHGKLVLIRTGSAMIVGVGSGNLTASGLETNAEVGGLYVTTDNKRLRQLDNLEQRLRHLALLDSSAGETVSPIALDETSRLLVSIDAALVDQMTLPSCVRRIEIVSPFVDGQLEVLQTIRELWPDAEIRLRLDPGFGALTETLLTIDDDQIEVLVPVESKEEKEDARRPAVHGKIICFVGDDEATVILGSANLSRPALLTRENFEAVIERRLPTHAVDKLLSVPHVHWRKATNSDRRSFSFADSTPSFSPLLATLTLRQLQLRWSAQVSTTGVARIWCRGRCVLEQDLGDVTELNGENCWNWEIANEVKNSLVASCFAEIELDNDKRFRGWVDVVDLLGVTPEAKRQLVLLDAIASDPLECKEKDVVKFIELLQRSLKSAGRIHSFSASKDARKEKEEYEVTPIQRRLLLESRPTSGFGQSLLLNQLITRSLDTALRDLRFFNRDNAAQTASKKKTTSKTASLDSSRNRKDEPSLPPKIESVLNQLFDQLAEAFDSTRSVRETAERISQIPTCLKALAYSVGRWLPLSQSERALNRYFHKVAIACLAPGIASILHKNGAVRRLSAAERAQLQGGSDFALGVAMLEAYLLLQFHLSNEESGSVVKDMHDVLKELPATTMSELKGAGTVLLQIGHRESDERPDFEILRVRLEDFCGELAGLRDCRNALYELIARFNRGVRSDAELRPLAEKATGFCDPGLVLDVIQSSGSKLRLVEVATDQASCPECYTTFPVAIRSFLNNTTRIWRCGCGVLLVRSLEQ